MKLLIRIALILAMLFASTFLIVKVSGILTIEDIKQVFESIQSQPSYVIGSLIILLLFADLFIAVPTMTVIILGAFFLGFQTAFIYAFIGLMLAAFGGYFISRLWGSRLLNKIIKNKTQLHEMHHIFQKHGILVLILCRAAPILPEVSACMSGISKMSFKKFVLGWLLGTAPYLLIVVYAGSISTLENPYPAILTAIGVTSALWLIWATVYYKKRRTKTIDEHTG